jgi:mannose-1-phosphate guanylyltransferase
MFVWRARTLLDCIRRYHPDNYRGLTAIAEAWDTPRQNEVVEALYPTLPRISVDFAVMEPASRDAAVRVVAVPMPLRWLDVGSWPSFAETCPKDADGNSLGGGKALLQGCRDTLVASSDPRHLIAAIGTRDLIVIHTPEATLVCPADQAEGVKAMQKRVAETLGHPYV